MPRPRIPVVKPQAIVPLGDAAVLIDFADTVDATVNAAIQRLARILHRKRVPWIRDVVPGLASLALHFDLTALGDRDPVQATEALIDECLARALSLIDEPMRAVEVPICYDEAFGLDLRELSEVLRMPIDEIARRHAGSELTGCRARGPTTCDATGACTWRFDRHRQSAKRRVSLRSAGRVEYRRSHATAFVRCHARGAQSVRAR
jgi:hypothetical protein